MVAASVDIKGGFNSVLPAVFSDQLGRLGLSNEIHNFIIYITSRRELYFSADGFEISIAKCQFSVFTGSRSDLSDLVLLVEGHNLPCLGGIKYLGVILDRRLTWAPHVRMISDKAIRSVNIIRFLSRVSWGVTPFLLLAAYRNLVRSTLE